jgi:hypothetical protein
MFGMHWPATWLLNAHLAQVKLRDTIAILNLRFPLVNQRSTSRPFVYHVAILSALLSFTDCPSTRGVSPWLRR